MSEFVADVLDGLACEWCGVYFKKEHGHPVVCKSCWDGATEEQRKNVQKAREAEA